MSELINIAVDAMGGDGSPKKIIDGIIYNHKNNKENFFKIFGNNNQIYDLINNKIDKNFYEIIHTSNQLKALIVLLKPQKKERILVCGWL